MIDIVEYILDKLIVVQVVKKLPALWNSKFGYLVQKSYRHLPICLGYNVMLSRLLVSSCLY
jgi:hypothetical protein